MRRALFLDRDGVINVDYGYISRPEHFHLVPGIVDVLRLAQERGYSLIIVTNQSGIARGYFSPEEYVAFERHVINELRNQDIELTAVYHCPHHPDGVIPEFSFCCSCRKPQAGLILQAAADHQIDLAESVLVGDKATDVAAGQAAGVGRSILIRPDSEFTRFSEIIAALNSD